MRDQSEKEIHPGQVWKEIKTDKKFVVQDLNNSEVLIFIQACDDLSKKNLVRNIYDFRNKFVYLYESSEIKFVPQLKKIKVIE